MAVLDKLFSVLILKKMDALVIHPGEIPHLEGGGSRHPATKNELDENLVLKLLNELPEARLDETGQFGETRRFQHRCEETDLMIDAQWTEDGWSARVTIAEETDELNDSVTAASQNSSAWDIEPNAISDDEPLVDTPPIFDEGPAVVDTPPVVTETPSVVDTPPVFDETAPVVDTPPVFTETPPSAETPDLAQSSADNGAAELPVSDETPSTPEIPVVESVPSTSKAPPSGCGLTELLEYLLEAGGSDLHISAGQEPRIRVHGDLVAIPGQAPRDSEAMDEMLFEVTPPKNREQFESTWDTDFAYDLPEKGRFRVNLFRDHKGTGAVLREIPYEIPSFQQLGLPDSLRRVISLSKGLVLVTGPTGSGKSTTLAAVVDLINRKRSDHIITVEDPIEFVHPSRKCLVNQREVGTHTDSFSQALRAALREDPDIVLVGEMRDLETTSIAIETAETGHLVFGTLHTTTAASTVERLVDQYPADRQAQIRAMLSQSLDMVIAQTLLKKIGGGRVAAFEILISTPAVSNLIREGKTFQITSAMQTGRGQGMQLLNDSLLQLVKDELVEPEEAYRKADNKSELLARFKAERIAFDPGTAGAEDEAQPQAAEAAAVQV